MKAEQKDKHWVDQTEFQKVVTWVGMLEPLMVEWKVDMMDG